jgi:ABC-type glycerol-3-phosphate transport system permease component
MKVLRVVVVMVFLLIAVLPLAWLALTSVKTYEDTISAHAKFVP